MCVDLVRGKQPNFVKINVKCTEVTVQLTPLLRPKERKNEDR